MHSGSDGVVRLFNYSTTLSYSLVTSVFRWCVFCSLIAGAVAVAQTTPTISVDPTSQTRIRYGDVPPSQFPQHSTFESLWRLELFDIALQLCESNLTRESAEIDEKTLWTRWKIQTLTRQYITNNRRSELQIAWDNERAKFQGLNHSERRLVWIDLELIRSRFLVTQQIAANFLARPLAEENKEIALSWMREVLEQAEDLAQEVETQLPLWAKSANGTNASPPYRQAQDLILDIALLRADCLLLRAQIYSEGSPDEIASATQANDALEQARIRLSSQWSGFEEFQLAWVESKIGMQRYSDAFEMLKQVAKSNNPQNEFRRIALEAEALRRLGRIQESANLLKRVASDLVAPEIAIQWLKIDLATIESTLQSEEMKRDDPRINALLSDALARKNAIGSTFGEYWLKRAEAILVQTQRQLGGDEQLTEDSNMGSRNGAVVAIELLVSEARQLLAASKYDKAIEKLLLAGDQCERIGYAERTLQIRKATAAVQQRLGKTGEAAITLVLAAETSKSHETAADTHLAGVWLQAELLETLVADRAGETTRLEEANRDYVEMLSRHVMLWPTSATASDSLERLQIFRSATGDFFNAGIDWLQGWIKFPSDRDRLANAAVNLSLEFSIRRCASMDRCDANALMDAIQLIQSSAISKEDKALAFDYLELLTRDRRWTVLDGKPQSLLAGVRTEFNAFRTAGENQFVDQESSTKLASDWEILKSVAQNIAEDDFSKAYRLLGNDMPERDSFLERLQWCMLISQSELRFDFQIHDLDSTDFTKAQTRIKNCLNNEYPARIREALLDAQARMLAAGIGENDEDDSLLDPRSLREQINASPRNTRARIRLAKLLDAKSRLDTANSQSALDPVLLELRTLNAGSKTMTDTWFSTKIFVAQVRQRIGNVDQASQGVELLLASYPEIPNLWASRLRRLLPQQQ